MQVAALIQLLQTQDPAASVLIELDNNTANVHGILHYNDESGNPFVIVSGDVATMKPLHAAATPV